MDTRTLIAYFTDEAKLLAAVREAREKGIEISDALTPFPVHGLDEAMGLAPSRLTWVAFIAGSLGFLVGVVFQIWTSAYDWPINIGGKPCAALPLFVPVVFELTVLSAGVITILALFIVARLHPLSRRTFLPRVSDDRFAIVLCQKDASLDLAQARLLFSEVGAVEIIEMGNFVA